MADDKHDGGHVTQVNARYALVIMILAVGVCLTAVLGVRYLMLHEEARIASHHD